MSRENLKNSLQVTVSLSYALLQFSLTLDKVRFLVYSYNDKHENGI